MNAPTNQRGAVRHPGATENGRRARLRLGGSWAITLAVLATVAYGGWWFSRAEVSPIRDVEVHGEFRYLDGRDIEVAVKPFLPDGFFGLDMNALRSALRAIPWVEEAELRRVWPGKLVLRLHERRALAAWRDGGYVSRRGERFQPDRGPQGLVVLGGPESVAAEAAERYRRLAPLVTDAGLVLRELGSDARRSWRMRVDRPRADGAVESIELKLGGADLRARLQRFTTVYGQRLADDTRRLANVDLRYTNGLAVRFAAPVQVPDTRG